MARYLVRAKSDAGIVDFQDPLTLQEALEKAAELRDAQFHHITLVNTRTGIEITDLEELAPAAKPARP